MPAESRASKYLGNYTKCKDLCLLYNTPMRNSGSHNHLLIHDI